MTDDVQRFATRFAAHHQHYSDMNAGRFEYAPGDDHSDEEEEDIRPHRRRRRGVLRRGIVLLSLFGLGWAIYDDPTRVGRWWSTANETFGPAIARIVDKALEPAPEASPTDTTSNSNMSVASTTPTLRLTSPPALAATPKPVEVYEKVAVKIEDPKPDEANPRILKNSGTADPDAPKVIAKLPPIRGVVAPPSDAQKKATIQDKYKARARAAGLHPNLSRVLLEKLNRRDFRNARYAIRTALQKTADDATFKWPRQRKAKLAMFEVRFVPGAAKGCRRYVVTIEKDRWLTTALPMEKCNVKRVQMSRAAKR